MLVAVHEAQLSRLCAFYLLPKDCASETWASAFIVCIITGRMVGALFLDHFGLFGLVAKPGHLGRVVGIVVMFRGWLISQSNFAARISTSSANTHADSP